jgi:DNA-binding NtrC family response regulator
LKRKVESSNRANPIANVRADMTMRPETKEIPKKIRVLLLEDERAFADHLIAELCRAGFDADWTRAETELELVCELEEMPDVILAEHQVSDFDALHALRILQQRGLNIPFIVIADTLGQKLAGECVKQGAADYLLKDGLDRLGSAVSRALEGKRSRG